MDDACKSRETRWDDNCKSKDLPVPKCKYPLYQRLKSRAKLRMSYITFDSNVINLWLRICPKENDVLSWSLIYSVASISVVTASRRDTHTLVQVSLYFCNCHPILFLYFCKHHPILFLYFLKFSSLHLLVFC